jgi:hypothetical protein
MTDQPLIVQIPHHLGKDEAIRRLKRGMAQVSTSVPLLKIEDESWSGDRLTFRMSGMGQEASGTADVSDTDVMVEIVLPWLLQRIAELAQKMIRTKTTLLLEKK